MFMGSPIGYRDRIPAPITTKVLEGLAQTVWVQVGLLLKEQSDLDPHR